MSATATLSPRAAVHHASQVASLGKAIPHALALVEVISVAHDAQRLASRSSAGAKGGILLQEKWADLLESAKGLKALLEKVSELERRALAECGGAPAPVKPTTAPVPQSNGASKPQASATASQQASATAPQATAPAPVPVQASTVAQAASAVIQSAAAKITTAPAPVQAKPAPTVPTSTPAPAPVVKPVVQLPKRVEDMPMTQLRAVCSEMGLKPSQGRKAVKGDLQRLLYGEVKAGRATEPCKAPVAQEPAQTTDALRALAAKKLKIKTDGLSAADVERAIYQAILAQYRALYR